MRTIVLLCAAFSSISISLLVQPPEVYHPMNGTSHWEELKVRSLDERARIAVGCTREHLQTIQHLLQRIADASRTAMLATPTISRIPTRLTSHIFERYFGPNNLNARASVHERFNRIRREALRSPGLPGLGLARLRIVCDEAYSPENRPCEGGDIDVQDGRLIVLVRKPTPA